MVDVKSPLPPAPRGTPAPPRCDGEGGQRVDRDAGRPRAGASGAPCGVAMSGTGARGHPPEAAGRVIMTRWAPLQAKTRVPSGETATLSKGASDEV